MYLYFMIHVDLMVERKGQREEEEDSRSFIQHNLSHSFSFVLFPAMLSKCYPRGIALVENDPDAPMLFGTL